MLGFVQHLFTPRINPIGIDFGTDCLRLAQVQYVEGDHRLIAAASAEVPPEIRNDAGARLEFFRTSVKQLLAKGTFRGRRAVLSLPSSNVHMAHLQMHAMDEQAMIKAIPIEAHDRMPIDLSQAMVRHIVAGEIYHGEEPKIEVIVMAAARESIGQFLSAALECKLDIVGMNVEPMAIVDCFRHVYRRKLDAEVTHCFIDIGAQGTRAVVARHGQILFARKIPIGGDHFTQAVAAAMEIPIAKAREIRIKLCEAAPQENAVAAKQAIVPRIEQSSPYPAEFTGVEERGEERDGAAPNTIAATALIEAPAEEPVDATEKEEAEHAAKHAQVIQQACREKMDQLVGELNACRSYYEASFSEKPMERLIFIGGEARQRSICHHIASRMGIPGQVGDPLCRMGRISKIDIESGIDRRLPQPSWVVAIGLSMGPPNREIIKHAFESDR